MQLSPMMQQYMDIKNQNKDCILFFRLGDFYEMFYDDALLVSKELELTLTGKSCGQDEKAPMCGVPFHSADTFVAKLVARNYKVAICEQVEDPALAKGLVKREVIRIVTPGTFTGINMLDEKENYYLCSLFIAENHGGFAYCDISTGELYSTEFASEKPVDIILNELTRIKCKELLLNKNAEIFFDIEEMKKMSDAFFNPLDEGYYKKENAERLIKNQLNTQSLKSIGLDEAEDSLLALGALFEYLGETQKQSLCHINTLKNYRLGKTMALDKATLRNLEITETLYDKKVQGSLLGVLDKTHTAMGGRKIKQWLREPLNETSEINERLDAVQVFWDDTLLRNNLKESLKRIYDLERLAGRIACGNANGKDLIALKNSIYVLPEIKEDLSGLSDSLISQLAGDISTLTEIYNLIEAAIEDEAPFTIKEGRLIKTGYSQELDSIKASIKDAKNWILNLESVERERTGIKNLKVGFNKPFGYYLEVTKSYYQVIPENYIRKQTLVNCERFITPELKETESLLLNAETKINKLEYEIFTEIRERIQKFIPVIQKTSAAISSLDVLLSFAEVSDALGYIRPEVDDSGEVFIKGGKHPVIEQTVSRGIFVPNDIYINNGDTSLLLITGPNMAGKSTYMRQTALIVLMAQSGCFVPCQMAKIGTVDRIFTRIGASDNLAQGQSTFFVEMSELAYILNSSTERSLIILDEIGRGTSTYDGLSIAWSVVEYLCKRNNHIRTLFATHYHELTSLEGTMPGFKNLNVDVAEENGEVVFLHKIVEGSASKSYGIHVAKLAGVPFEILEKAKDKLSQLENTKKNDNAVIYDNNQSPKEETSHWERNGSPEHVQEQISFFSFAPNPVVEKLKALNLMDIKPSEAFKILEELKDAADD